MTLTPLHFLIVSLAVWRISSLLVSEDGPFDIFAKFRHFIGVRYDANSNAYGTNMIAKGLTCLWCTSIWISAVGAVIISANFLEYILLVLSLSATAIVVECTVNKG